MWNQVSLTSQHETVIKTVSLIKVNLLTVFT